MRVSRIQLAENGVDCTEFGTPVLLAEILGQPEQFFRSLAEFATVACLEDEGTEKRQRLDILGYRDPVNDPVHVGLDSLELPSELHRVGILPVYIFGNFSLTATERLLFGFRPLDEEGDFTGFARRQGGEFRSTNGFDGEPHRFFIEGYLDELFPRLDPEDRLGLDIGYSFGRQPLFLQDGILANDDVDAVGFTKHNFFRMNASATRLSGFVAFNEVHRNDNRRDSGATLFALSNTLDYPKRTLEVDTAYVIGSSASGGDGFYFGIGQIKRFGHWNSTFRMNTSVALAQGGPAVNDGWLFTHQFSRTMKHSEDILTLGMFAEIDDYTSAARGPATGGALGGFSLLQRAVGIGTYGSPSNLAARDALGFEISYQHFLDAEARRQLLVSAGVSASENLLGIDSTTGAVALQYQQQLTRNLIWILGGFSSITEDDDKGFGMRTELLRKF